MTPPGTFAGEPIAAHAVDTRSASIENAGADALTPGYITGKRLSNGKPTWVVPDAKDRHCCGHV
jgi:hypothetical protein